MKYIQSLQTCITDLRGIKSYIPTLDGQERVVQHWAESDLKVRTKMAKKIEKKLQDMIELMEKYKNKVVPMEIVAQLAQIPNMQRLSLPEQLKATFMALIVREYRKFKEVSQIREHKKQAEEQLKKQRAARGLHAELVK